MSFLCRRCYINSHELSKKEIKKLTSSADKFKCDGCGEYKAIVLEPRKREVWEDNEDF
jgi:hypothetical protein